MSHFGSESGNVLYLIVCAAPPASDTVRRVRANTDRGLEVCVIATPLAMKWLDVDTVERASGHPVQHEFHEPGEERFGPPGDAILLSPATFNTINQWAAGMNDNLALGVLNEGLGAGVPIIAQPHVNAALAAHPAYRRSLELLIDAGVTFTAVDG